MHMVVDFPKSLRAILNYVKNEEDRLRLYFARNNFGSTAFHCATYDQPFALNSFAILMKYCNKINGILILLLKMLDSTNKTVWDYIKDTPKTLNYFLHYFDVTQSVKDVESALQNPNAPSIASQNSCNLNPNQFFSSSVPQSQVEALKTDDKEVPGKEQTEKRL